MGDWEEKEQEDKTKIVVCPTADGLGCYKYFEYHKDESSEYLAGVFFAEDGEKQFVRFERKKSE